MLLACVHCTALPAQAAPTPIDSAWTKRAETRQGPPRRTAPAAMQGPACRWCMRDRTTPNPLLRDDDALQEPHLQFTKKEAAECVPCRNFVAAAWKGRARSDLLKQIESNPKARDAFVEGVKQWETLYLASANGRCPRNSLLPDTLQSLSTIVTRVDRMELVMQRDLGVFWPVDIYEAHHKSKPSPAKLVTIKEDGVMLRGVILPVEKGEPAGTIHLQKRWSQGGERTAGLGDTASELRPGQVDDTWKALQARGQALQICPANAGDADPCCKVLGVAAPKAKAKAAAKKRGAGGFEPPGSPASSDEMDWLRDCIHTAPAAAGKKRRAEEEAAVTDVSDRLGASSLPDGLQAQAKGKAKAAVKSPKVGQATGADMRGGLQQHSMLKAMQAVISEAEAVLKAAAASDSFPGLTERAAQSALDKVQKKLVPTVLAVCAAEHPDFVYQGGEGEVTGATLAAQAVVAVASLKRLQGQLGALVEVVRSYHADAPRRKGQAAAKALLATHEALQGTLEKARAAGLELPPLLPRTVVQRAAESMFASGFYWCFAYVLAPRAPSPLITPCP